MRRGAGAGRRVVVLRRTPSQRGRRLRLVSGCAVVLLAVLAACGRYGSVQRLPRATAPAATAPGEAPDDAADEEDDDQ